jgi:hypothetical protein
LTGKRADFPYRLFIRAKTRENRCHKDKGKREDAHKIRKSRNKANKLPVLFVRTPKEEREIFMEKYIEGNKAAWEEAFDKRDGQDMPHFARLCHLAHFSVK